MKSLLILSAFLLAAPLTRAAEPDAVSTCGNVNLAMRTMRDLARKASQHKPARISERQALQVLSALISYKLEDSKLTDSQRNSLQDEHEAACGTF